MKFNPIDKSKNYFKSELLKALTKSIEKRIDYISKNKLGFILSGGLDSSAIVAIASKSIEPNTFSVGFDVESFNELPYARIVSDSLNTNHHEIMVTSDDIKYMPKIAWHLDDLSGGGIALPFYLALNEGKRNGINFMMGGAGSDEMQGTTLMQTLSYLQHTK